MEIKKLGSVSGKGKGEYYNIFSFKVAHACCIQQRYMGMVQRLEQNKQRKEKRR